MNETAAIDQCVYDAAQIRRIDQYAINTLGIPGLVLMNRAAAAAWQVLVDRWPTAKRIAVLCGAGNNAGDGYLLARLAKASGREVAVHWTADPQHLRGDAARAYQAARAVGIDCTVYRAGALSSAALIVDALLGTGLDREVSGPFAAAIAETNHGHAPVLALDICSGLHADSGAVLGQAVQANATVSFVGIKSGLLHGRGPRLSGQLHVDTLGIPASAYQHEVPLARIYRGADLVHHLPARPVDAHKGQCGHVLVIGGDLGAGGAALLAASAAARSGAGLVSIATRGEHISAMIANRPELMPRAAAPGDTLTELIDRASVIAIGPGLGTGEWARGLYTQAISTLKPKVVDADALSLLAQNPIHDPEWVLTPHPGEAARLLAVSSSSAIQNNRLDSAHQIQQKYGGVCVLKGHATIVKTGQEPASLCPYGNPGMASGGMGDVLTGMIAALLAQGLDAYNAARVGVHIHAMAADTAARRRGQRGLLAGDLLEEIRTLANPP